MRALVGKRIALACQRRVKEITRLVEKFGGVPLWRPTMQTLSVSDDPEVQAVLLQIVRDGVDWFIFTTGVGVQATMEAAELVGCKEALIDVLRNAQLAVRGYKTAQAIRSLGLTAFIRDQDGTTESLKSALDAVNFSGTKVAVQAYGEPIPSLTAWLEKKGATVIELLLYRHIPAPPEALNTLLNEIVQERVDAVLFTSPPQVRFLFNFAHQHSADQKLCAAFNHQVVAAAVGHVTAGTLKGYGVANIVMPDEERIGAAIVALANYFERCRRKDEL